MEDEGQQAGEGDVWNNGWRDKERKTLSRMVRRHQEVG